MARIKRFTRAGVAQTHNVVPSRPTTYPLSSSSSSSDSDSDSETERLLTRRRVVRRKRAVPKTKKAPVAPSPTQEADDDFIIQPSAETIMKVTRMVTENECLIQQFVFAFVAAYPSFVAAYPSFDAAHLRFAAAGVRPAADCAHQAAGSACGGGHGREPSGCAGGAGVHWRRLVCL